MANLQSNRSKFLIAALVLMALAGGGYFAYKVFFPAYPNADITIIKALKSVSEIKRYAQEVETETQVSDRSLKITGTYLVDNPGKQFASFSTTSLFIKGDPRPHSFSHQDIAIGDDVYFRVTTIDPYLIATIKNNANWTYFKNGSIPPEDASIAIAGPVQDNLSALSENGRYLTFVKKVGSEEIAGTELVRYRFVLSKNAFDLPDGPLNAIVGRLGKTGTIDVWINPSTFAVVQLLFQNAPYFSTTTISSVNAPLPIIAPIAKPAQQ